MVKLLLSSRAFSTVAVTDAFFTLVAPVAKNSARIVIIVNSVSTGKNHPQMVWHYNKRFSSLDMRTCSS
ncbi:hypothetical protein [Lactiplantibacillus plantarum]|uniref:hypothetical protein n=1 Tax=Lactiplantibacillus plantarum TaxID=1590 RepID=UPI001FF09385|nr:hypothetical protein [Lactiplantibacillus plantarum]